MEIGVNKTKIVIGINIVFIALIIAAFLPALKSSDEGYNTKTVAVKPAQQEDIASTEVETPEASTATDQAIVEQQIASTTAQDSEEVTPEESAANDAEVAPSTEATTELETTANTEPVAPTTQTATPKDEPTVAATSEPEKPVIEAETPAEDSATSVAETKTPATSTTTDALYSVVDGNKLDAHSYGGFKLYRNWCARCHGTYGQGMVGPDLAESLKVISKEEFYDTVENGKSGTIGSMPAWKANVQVMENRDQLYAYLKARSDGAIGVEKPVKQK